MPSECEPPVAHAQPAAIPNLTGVVQQSPAAVPTIKRLNGVRKP